MEISASLVKQLREITDAGMMDCKKALVEVKGDIEKAIEFLREKGLSKAAKKADRVAAEGTIALFSESDSNGDSSGVKRAIMVEINSETDFVAKNENFKNLCAKTLELANAHNVSDIDALNALNVDGVAFADYLKGEIAKIGENIVVRRIALLDSTPNTIVGAYLHSNARIGTIVALKFKNAESKSKLSELVNNLCMHAAAMKPKIISAEAFENDFIQKEKAALVAEIKKENEEAKRLGKTLKNVPEFVSKKELTKSVLDAKIEDFKANLRAQKKPENIIDKIASGMIERFIADNTLLDQRLSFLGQYFVMDDKKSIEKILAEKSAELNDSIEIAEYVRFELGEGIEKVAGDFAKEVAEQMK